MKRAHPVKIAYRQQNRRARLINSQIARETRFSFPDNILRSNMDWSARGRAHYIAKDQEGSRIERKNTLIKEGFLEKGQKIQIGLEGFGVKNLSDRRSSMRDIKIKKQWKKSDMEAVNPDKEIKRISPTIINLFKNEHMRRNPRVLNHARSEYIFLKNRLRATGRRKDLKRLEELESELFNFVEERSRSDQALRYSRTELIERLREKPFEERMKWKGASDQDIEKMKRISLDKGLSPEQKLKALEKVNKKLVDRLKEELIDEYLEAT